MVTYLPRICLVADGVLLVEKQDESNRPTIRSSRRKT